MSFSKQYKKFLVTEWKEYYFSFFFLKKMLTLMDVCAPMPKRNHYELMRSIDDDLIYEEKNDYLLMLIEKIEEIAVSEVNKANDFLIAKMGELEKDFKNVKYNLILYYCQKEVLSEKAMGFKLSEMKLCIKMFYTKVMNLLLFYFYNKKAVKYFILKYSSLIILSYDSLLFQNQKRDLQLESKFKEKFQNAHLKRLKFILSHCTSMYLSPLFFPPCFKEYAQKELKHIIKHPILSMWDSYFLSFFSGFSLILFIFIIVLAWNGNIDPDDNETFGYVFPIFRGAAFFIVYLWLLGLNVYGWSFYHVNYKKALDFKGHFSLLNEILMRAAFFTTVFLIVFLWYILLNDRKHEDYSMIVAFIPKNHLPLIIWGVLLIYMLFPSKKVFNGRGRWFMFSLLFEVFFCAPFFVNFNATWVNDQMLSLVVPIRDMAYTFCLYVEKWRNYADDHPAHCFENTITVGFLTIFIPVVTRVIQFIRVLKDQGYIGGPNFMLFLCVLIVLINTIFSYLWGISPENEFYFISWVISAICLSSYGFYMDVAVDWLLFQPNSKHRFLRDKLYYPKKKYYWAIILDFFLRFAWILTINPALCNKIMRPELFTFVVALLEIFRRVIWNFLRIEKEMILNLDKYVWQNNFNLPYGPLPKNEENIFDELWKKQDFIKIDSEEESPAFHFDFDRELDILGKIKKKGYFKIIFWNSIYIYIYFFLNIEKNIVENRINIFKKIDKKLKENNKKIKEVQSRISGSIEK